MIRREKRKEKIKQKESESKMKNFDLNILKYNGI